MLDTKETFPRGPSNEQTLLTELGQCKGERDALAVANERMRLALLRIGQHSFQSVTDGHRCRRVVVDALLCTVEELETMS